MIFENDNTVFKSSIFRNLIDKIKNVVVIIDNKGTIIYSNQTAAQLLGYSLDEMVGNNVKMLVPKDVAEHHDQYIKDYIRTGKNKFIDNWGLVEIFNKAGEKKYVQINVVELDIGDDKYFAGIINDVSAYQESEIKLKNSMESLSIAQHIANIGNWDWNIQTGDLFWSDQIYRIFGLKVKEFEATYDAFVERVHPDDIDNVNSAVQRAIEKDEKYDVNHRIIRPDGEIRWVHEEGDVIRNEKDEPVRMLGVVLDITERKEYEDRLQLTQKVFNNTAEAILITDSNAKIIQVNRAFENITGYTESEVLGKDPGAMKSGRHSKQFYKEMWDEIHATGAWQGEIWDRKKNGQQYPKWLSINKVTDSDGQILHYIGVFSDITSIKETEDRLHYLAYYDSLTGLSNQLFFRDKIEARIKEDKNNDDSFALAVLDIDNFKRVNDSIGHRAGDNILIQIAERLNSGDFNQDSVARLSGDNYLICINKNENGEFDPSLHKLKDIIQSSYSVEGLELHMTACIGVSVYPDDGKTFDELIMNADGAMHEAKTKGAGVIKYASPKLNIKLNEKLTIESNLREALKNNEIIPYFQPKIDINTGKTVGMEALARWPKGDGFVYPDVFIPVAEETGLIDELGWQILDNSLKFNNKILEAGYDLSVAVNMSPKQITTPEIIDTVSDIIVKNCYSPEKLQIEITESALIEDIDIALSVLKAFKKMKIVLSLDDFGTGYSSLSYLAQLPVKVLKIDKSFFDVFPYDLSNYNMVAGIISMAKNLNLTVVAEGVETEEQLKVLKELGCNQVQGYYYSKPLPEDEFIKFIEENLKY